MKNQTKQQGGGDPNYKSVPCSDIIKSARYEREDDDFGSSISDSCPGRAHDGSVYGEVKTLMAPDVRNDEGNGLFEEAENDDNEPNLKYIDAQAFQRLAPLFVTLPENELEVDIKRPSRRRNHKFTLYSEKTGLIRADSLLDMCQGSLFEFLCQNVFWLDIQDPSLDEIRGIAEIFKLHQLTLEDMELESDDPEMREKCDVFHDYFYISLKAVDSEASSGLGPLVWINMAILTFPGMVITTHKEPLFFYRTVAKRIRLLTARSYLSADWILYAILEDLMDFFSVSGQQIETEVDAIDELVMVLTVNDQEDILHRIGSIRKRVLQQLRFVSNKTEIMRTIVKRAAYRFSEDAGFYLRDLQEQVEMLDKNMDQYDDSLNRSHNNYLAQISIEISHTSNKLNDIMKKLTVVTSVVLPWSLVSSLWGMNIKVPGYGVDSFAPFSFLALLAVSLSFVSYIMCSRLGWF